MSLFKTVQMQAQSVTSSRTKGKNTDSVGPAFFFKGSFQPANGEDLKALPEGRRSDGVFKVYSDLNFDTVTSANNPDQIVVDGKVYEIVGKAPWRNQVINHYKYLLQECKTK